MLQAIFTIQYKDIWKVAHEYGFKFDVTIVPNSHINPQRTSELGTLLNLTLIQNWLRETHKLVVKPWNSNGMCGVKGYGVEITKENTNPHLYMYGNDTDQPLGTYVQALALGIYEALHLLPYHFKTS